MGQYILTAGKTLLQVFGQFIEQSAVAADALGIQKNRERLQRLLVKGRTSADC